MIFANRRLEDTRTKDELLALLEESEYKLNLAGQVMKSSQIASKLND